MMMTNTTHDSNTKKYKSMKKTGFILAFLLVTFGVFAQPGTADVTVIGNGNREIEPAYRIPETPKIIDTVKTTPVASYPMLTFQGKTKIYLDTIEAATVETTEKLRQLYPFYAKVGIGSVIMPLAELYYNSTRSRGTQYGAHVKHLGSYSNNIKDRNKVSYAPSQYDRTDVLLFGKAIETNYIFNGSLRYKNDGFHYYGIPNDTISADSISQRIQQVGAAMEFTGNRGDTSMFNYRIGADYNYLFSKKPNDSLADWKTQEHHFDFKAKGWYNFKSESFYGNIGVRFNGYKYGIADSSLNALDSGIVKNNTIIDFQPGVLTQKLNDKLRVDVGVQLSIDVQAKTRAYVYPQLSLQYAMANNKFIPFIGITGGLKQGTFRSFYNDNAYVLTNLQLQNEHNPYTVYGGFKGAIGKKVGFNVNASFGRVMNKGFFVTDTLYSQRNKFSLVYDTLNLTKVEASLSYQLAEKIKIDGIGRFYSYETKNQAYAWNLPTLQFVLRGNYNLYDKFLLNLDGTIEAGRKAMVYGPGTGVKQENGQYYVSLGTIADVNLGLEYRYNTRVSIFLQGNNLLSQRYLRWYNYPVQPIQVMGGITARF